MTNLRPIKALQTPGIEPKLSDAPKPEFIWVSPTELLVDESYQRNLSDRSVSLIRRIVGDWDWRRVKPVVCARTEAGLEVIDGQHTAIAAASHPGVEMIPVCLVEAEARADRAAAFIGHNRDRIVVTVNQMHVAAVAAGDEDALTVQQVCDRAGIRILKNQPSGGAYRARDTMAVSAIGTLCRRLGAKRAREVLEVLANAELAPISVHAIRAADLLLNDAEYRGLFEPEDLTTTIRAMVSYAERDAKVFAAAHGLPMWKALAITWFKKVRRRGRR